MPNNSIVLIKLKYMSDKFIVDEQGHSLYQGSGKSTQNESSSS